MSVLTSSIFGDCITCGGDGNGELLQVEIWLRHIWSAHLMGIMDSGNVMSVLITSLVGHWLFCGGDVNHGKC